MSTPWSAASQVTFRERPSRCANRGSCTRARARPRQKARFVANASEGPARSDAATCAASLKFGGPSAGEEPGRDLGAVPAKHRRTSRTMSMLVREVLARIRGDGVSFDAVGQQRPHTAWLLGKREPRLFERPARRNAAPSASGQPPRLAVLGCCFPCLGAAQERLAARTGSRRR